MLKKLQNKEKGFTIIEVLIVLAVGGLIIAIVLLAVPALQRNQRNSARGTDAGRIATAASNFSADNNGTLPASGDAQAILDDAGKLGQYSNVTASTTAGAGKFNVQTTQLTTAPAAANTDQITLVVGGKCGTSGTTSAGNARQMALVYMVETSGTNKPVCKDI